jgi:hypothetical protein
MTKRTVSLQPVSTLFYPLFSPFSQFTYFYYTYSYVVVSTVYVAVYRVGGFGSSAVTKQSNICA